MDIKTFLLPELTVCNCCDHNNKKQVLEHISRLASQAAPDLKYQYILEALLQRERLGSTALGHGVAIPHARIKGITQPILVLVTLKNAINFSSDENVAVDLIFGLLVPESATEEHLSLLSMLTSKLRDKAYRDKLRNAKTDEELYSLATTTNNAQIS